jgi:hypothetical protein
MHESIMRQLVEIKCKREWIFLLWRAGGPDATRAFLIVYAFAGAKAQIILSIGFIGTIEVAP